MSGSTSSPRPSPTSSARSPTAPSSRARCEASERSCTRRRCTSRMSARMGGTPSSRRTCKGALILLEEAARAGVEGFVMTSTTSAFGDALVPAAGRTGGLDRRDGRAGSEEHLRRHQNRRRGPLPPLLAQRAAALHRAQNLALLSGSRRRPERAGGVRGGQSEGERVSLPPRRDRGRGRRASAWPPNARRRSASAST